MGLSVKYIKVPRIVEVLLLFVASQKNQLSLQSKICHVGVAILCKDGNSRWLSPALP